MAIPLKKIDYIEILTLVDNYIDLLSMYPSETITRAIPVKDNKITNSILAEHGFSVLVTVTFDGQRRSILYDFGYSSRTVMHNVNALDVDLNSIESLALSHGHLDHFGGLETLAKMIGKKGMDLVLHPAAFKSPRYFKPFDEVKIDMPSLKREPLVQAGINIIETSKPHSFAEGHIFSTGEIPRRTEYEKGVPYLFCLHDGVERLDPIEDDMALMVNVKDKGLVVLTGCAHAGVVNTVNYAKELTGESNIHLIMGGFHLTGPDFEQVTPLVTEAFQAMNPRYIVPTHCTGREAIMHMEKEMPQQFLLNMSGTLLSF